MCFLLQRIGLMSTEQYHQIVTGDATCRTIDPGPRQAKPYTDNGTCVVNHVCQSEHDLHFNS